MTIEDIREFKKNAVAILEKDTQYATARAVEEAFMALACLGQYMWERDIAISQLKELGLSLGQKVNHVKELIEKNKAKNLVNYDNCRNKTVSMRCPTCFESVGASCWKYCPECGQRLKR